MRGGTYMSEIKEKKCKGCETIKPVGEFYSRKDRISVYSYKCKICIRIDSARYHQENRADILVKQAKYRENNPDCSSKLRARHPDYHAKYYQNNKEKHAASMKAHRANNPNLIKAQGAKYRENNPDKLLAKSAKRRAAKLQRTVAWADLKKIEEVYADCVEINLAAKTAGCTERYVVDHKIPLQGKLVSGFHIHTNLQIILEFENGSKGNRFTPGPHYS